MAAMNGSTMRRRRVDQPTQRPMVIHGQYRLFDVGGAIGLIGMAAMLVAVTTKNTVRLYREERIR